MYGFASPPPPRTFLKSKFGISWEITMAEHHTALHPFKGLSGYAGRTPCWHLKGSRPPPACIGKCIRGDVRTVGPPRRLMVVSNKRVSGEPSGDRVCPTGARMAPKIVGFPPPAHPPGKRPKVAHKLEQPCWAGEAATASPRSSEETSSLLASRLVFYKSPGLTPEYSGRTFESLI